MKVYYYWIHHNERGEFYATIEDIGGNEVVSINTEYAEFLSREGVNLNNVTSIWNYFRTIDDIPFGAILTRGQPPIPDYRNA